MEAVLKIFGRQDLWYHWSPFVHRTSHHTTERNWAPIHRGSGIVCPHCNLTSDAIYASCQSWLDAAPALERKLLGT